MRQNQAPDTQRPTGDRAARHARQITPMQRTPDDVTERPPLHRAARISQSHESDTERPAIYRADARTQNAGTYRERLTVRHSIGHAREMRS